MNHDFAGLMAKKTDDELIAIVTARRDEYSPAALIAADAEMDKRNVPVERLETIKKEQAVIKEQDTARANEPLEGDIKFLTMVFPLIAWMTYADKFRQGGYDRKLEDMASARWRARMIYLGLVALF